MGEKVLLVDDDVDFVEVNREVLEEKGYQVEVAHNGKKALEKALSEKPDIIILDVVMTTPTEGIHVAQELRKNEKTKDIPIIMLTGVREKMGIPYQIGPEEEYLPVTEFIEKPFPPAKLVEKVEQMLRKGKN